MSTEGVLTDTAEIADRLQLVVDALRAGQALTASLSCSHRAVSEVVEESTLTLVVTL